MEYFKQEKDYTCGCACVKMALSMFEPEFIEEELLEKELDTKPNRGTDPKNVEKFFIDRNYDVVSKEHSSVEEIQKYFEEGWAVFLAVSVDVPHFTMYGGHNGNHIKFLDPYFGIIHGLIKHFQNERMKFPTLRWRVVPEEFKKYFPDYDFDGNESHKYFLAVKKKSS